MSKQIDIFEKYANVTIDDLPLHLTSETKQVDVIKREALDLKLDINSEKQAFNFCKGLANRMSYYYSYISLVESFKEHTFTVADNFNILTDRLKRNNKTIDNIANELISKYFLLRVADDVREYIETMQIDFTSNFNKLSKLLSKNLKYYK